MISALLAPMMSVSAPANQTRLLIASLADCATRLRMAAA